MSDFDHEVILGSKSVNQVIQMMEDVLYKDVVYKGVFQGILVYRTEKIAFPGVSGFEFEYSDPDNHISHISFGHFLDEKGFNNRNTVIEFGNGTKKYQYSWSLNLKSLPGTVLVTDFQTICGSSNACDLNERIPILMGFQSSLPHDYGHIQDIKVGPPKVFASGNYGCCGHFCDRHYERTNMNFCYAFIDKKYVREVVTIKGKSVNGVYEGNLSMEHPVLQGFSVRYTKTDHHIKRFSIQTRDNLLSVMFYDKDKKDEIEFEITLVDLMLPNQNAHFDVDLHP